MASREKQPGMGPDKGEALAYEAINHSPEAVFVSQTLANFFVGECRRNSHVRNPSLKLFWDYRVSQATQPEFEQCYLIPVRFDVSGFCP